jgi:hypothetical protein
MDLKNIINLEKWSGWKKGLVIGLVLVLILNIYFIWDNSQRYQGGSSDPSAISVFFDRNYINFMTGDNPHINLYFLPNGLFVPSLMLLIISVIMGLIIDRFKKKE